ncbi:MAG: hypothetical protein CVV23_12830 [Ignavibacteriae bacterium HGW-Ignavibacteriae-2]|jgi:hypothetical protein|nr:hypothetical protein [Bacteroidota bacterium]PKL87960.1 MAG: hypothetical protein CVV23_12830 [Ignavibacteriae bacterium HGW-Ignavibacteriae-2]
MNAKQKIILYTGLGVIIISLLIWQIYGGEIFTKTQVLIEVNDELFGPTKQWQKKFVWGLDLTALISIITVIVSGLNIFIFRDKKK